MNARKRVVKWIQITTMAPTVVRSYQPQTDFILQHMGRRINLDVQTACSSYMRVFSFEF